MFVELSEVWERRALNSGNARQDFAEAAQLQNYGGEYGDCDHRADHILACRTECVVAKVLRQPWNPSVGIITSIDVGGKVEVRARRTTNGTDLAIRPKDKDDLPVVLVHVYPDDRMDVVGWLWIGEAKQRKDKVWCAKRAIWYVPPPYRPIDELKLTLTSQLVD